jgi:hypothetical protein
MGTSSQRIQRQLERLAPSEPADAEFHLCLADVRHRYRLAALVSCRVRDVVTTSDLEDGGIVVRVRVLPASRTCPERVRTILDRVDRSVRDLVAAEPLWR